MPITTTVAPMYKGRILLVAILCLVFGGWGAYDYWIAIPKQQAQYARYEELKNTFERLEESRLEHLRTGAKPSPAEVQEYQAVTNELGALAPGGTPPKRVGKWDRFTQWFFISCFPFAFYFVWLYRKAVQQRYSLDEAGTLQFQGDPILGSGAWRADEIGDIDMSRWMSKSIAHAVHRDGKRLKLDAYLHKNLELIIGAVASRLYPDKWDKQAKPVKEGEDEAGDSADSEVAMRAE